MGDNTKQQTTPPNAKRSLVLRFEYEGQLHELASLTTADTIGDLRAVVCSMLNIDDFDRINLKTLQPTKIIDTSDDKKQLSDVFRQTREKIIVEEKSKESTSDHYRQNYHQPKSINSTPTSSSSSTSQPINDSRPSAKHHKGENEDQALTSDDLPLGNKLLYSQSANMPAPPGSTISDESPIRPRKTPREQADQVPVCSSTGYLLRHPVPSNNSCLFISIHFCLTNGVVDDQIGKSMRKIIAETVASDKERFDDAFLGKSNADYCKWILDDNNWGGAIELSILCKYYETEIVAIDVKNTILNRFGEDSHYNQRMLLLYDGLHYDPLKFQPIDENKSIQTLFPTENVEVLTLAEEIAKESKQSHQFTDLKELTMICATCKTELDAKSVSEHAAKTGHVDFNEIVNK